MLGVNNDLIIRYMGSFRQGTKSIVVTEYAPNGSLEELFESNDRPTSPKDLEAFLDSLVDVSKAIDSLQKKLQKYG